MKKILSLLCVLTLCLSASAAGKKVSSSAASPSSAASGSSKAKSSYASSSKDLGNKKGKWAITADLGFSGGSNITTQPDATGTMVTTTTPANTSSFNIAVGGTYFILDELEVGLNMGYNNTKNFLRVDPVTGGNMFQSIGAFTVSPYVGYHVRICNWLHYVPQFSLGLAVGSGTRDLSLNPKQQAKADSFSFITAIEVANFEILASEHFSLTLGLGGFNFTTNKTEDKVNNITQVQNTFALTLFRQANVGVRYYF